MNRLRFCCLMAIGTFLLVLTDFGGVIAQEVSVLTLAESIEVAKQSNLTIQAAEENLKAAEAQVRVARAGLLPRVTADSNYTYFKDIQTSVIQAGGGFQLPMPGGEEEMEQSPPPPSADNESELIELEFGAHHNFQGGVRLTQPVFAWGRYYYAYQAAKLNYEATEKELRAAYNQLRLDVSQAFYRVLVAEEFVRVAQQSVRLVEEQLEIAQTTFATGTATNFDVLRAKVQLANAKSQLVQAKNSVRTAKDLYKTLLNIPLGEEVKIQGALEIPEVVLQLDALIQRAYENRPDIQRSKLNEHALQKQVDVAKSRSRPDLNFFTNYQISHSERLTRMNRIWSLGFQINIPIFDGFATRATVQQTESVLKQAELGSQQLTSAVEFEVRSAYLSLLEAQTLIEVQRETVAQARESVRIANLQFENGMITTVALTDTQLALAQAEISRLRAYHDYAIGLAQLEKAVGAPLSE